MLQKPFRRRGIDGGALMMPYYVQRAYLGGPYWPLVAPEYART